MPVLARVVDADVAVVERVVEGIGLPEHAAASLEMAAPDERHTAVSGVVAWRSRLPLEKVFVLSLKIAVKTAAAATDGMTTYHRVPRPRAAAKRRGCRATLPRVNDLSS